MLSVRLLLLLVPSLFVGPLQAATDADVACSAEQISKAFSSVAKQAFPAVVYIKAQGVGDEEVAQQESAQNPYDMFNDDLFERFFGVAPRKSPKQQQVSQGSGFIVTPEGYIMTNAHVVKGASKITVTLNDGLEMDASLVGLDSSTDLAILKIEGKDYPYLTMGNSDVMDIGEWVVAIGNPFQLGSTLTVGVVSAKRRQNLQITKREDFIQTDAAINPGNSGGPLLNLKGQVIGINTAIVSRSGGHMGIGFAIPSNMAIPIMHQIIDKGSVSPGYLGVSLQPVDKDLADAFHLDRIEGALVSEVMKDSPADKGGLKQGDIILEYNDTTVKSSSIGTFSNDVFLMGPGTKVKLKVNRNGKIVMLAVTLGSPPDELTSSSGVSLGFEIQTLTPELAKQLDLAKGEEGVVVTKVKPGTPAAVAGMRPGYLILAVNHKKVKTVDDFQTAMKEPVSKNRVLILALIPGKNGNVTRFYSIKVE